MTMAPDYGTSLNFKASPGFGVTPSTKYIFAIIIIWDIFCSMYGDVVC